MSKQIFYSTALGKAVASVEGKPLKYLGQFKGEAAARAACEQHLTKVCRAADNFGRPRPQAFFL